MLHVRGNGKGESLCVDGDLKRVAGRLAEATTAYLSSYVADPHYTQLHLLDSLTPKEKESIIVILQDWLKNDSKETLRKKLPGVKNVANEVWKFAFMLDAEIIKTCIAHVDTQMKEKRFRQVVDVCTAIIDHSGNDTATMLVQRAIAYTLMDGFNKQAVADCLRAFAKDKEGTIQVLRNKHGTHFPQVSELLRAFVYSKPVGSENQKSEKWLKLTTDCCRLLLAMDSSNFPLQMTYVERMTAWNKFDLTSATLHENIRVLCQETNLDLRKLAECWIRLGYCCYKKPHIENAITYLTRGLNMPVDFEIDETKKDNAVKGDKQSEYDITKTFLEDNYEVQHVGKVARDIFNGDSAEIGDIIANLDKNASRLCTSEKSSATPKLHSSVPQAVEYYRAILVLKPKHRETLIKLATCFSKLGRNNFSIKIYDYLLTRKDYAQDSVILSARAACYREIGKKNEARKDYDALLRHSPMDATLLFERSLVHLENEDVDSIFMDLEAACKSNQRTVSICMNKLPLAQRTRIRQMLYDRARNMMQYTQHPTGVADTDSLTASTALSITQLLTRLNSKDHAAQILKAHSFYYHGRYDDAEVTLKRLLDSNPENSDNHVIRLHLGMLRIFMNKADKGIPNLTKVLQAVGENVVAGFVKDISASQRNWLYSAVHRFAVAMLQKEKDNPAVQRAISCFTIAILCCAEAPGNSSELTPLQQSHWKTPVRQDATDAWDVSGLHGLCKSYLARAECHAHFGDQENAILDFTSALEVNPVCDEALCGRAFMRLALGDEQGCVNDIVKAGEVAMPTLTAHIAVLPEDAKRILLHWLDQHVITLLLEYAAKDRLAFDRRDSTISITVETANIVSNISPSSDTSSGTLPSQTVSPSSPDDVAMIHQKSNGVDSPYGGTNESIASSVFGGSKSEATSVMSNQSTTASSSETRGGTPKKRRGFHKSSADVRKFNHIQMTAIQERATNNSEITSTNTPSTSSAQSTRPPTTITTQTSLSCDDVISGVVKTERLQRAQIIGKLLIAVDPANPVRHGMYADIFILKGDFEEGLRHLQIVMQLSPADVTAAARAGLICAKQNRYDESANLLSSLIEVDLNLLVYVLKSLDSTLRRRLSEESHRNAIIMSEEDDFVKAIEYFGLSLLASDHKRLEKLRLRALCFMKLKNNKRALEDMFAVIKEAGMKASVMDFCARGHIYLMDNKDKEACSDYSKALKINHKQACLLIHSKPGLAPLSRVFHRQALEEFICHNFERCLLLCDDGILVDSSNIDLRKLRARARKEAGNCLVQ